MELKPSNPILLRYESFYRIQGTDNIATTFGEGGGKDPLCSFHFPHFFREVIISFKNQV